MIPGLSSARAASLWAAVVLSCVVGRAEAALAVASDPATCLGVIVMAEREAGLPSHLLQAIALVETGRIDPVTGKIVPWAWSLDANGVGQSFETKQAAIAAAESKLASGIASVDVGCMQVNLAYHPRAFASLDEAFEPEMNVRYAARLLVSLYRQFGNWADAAMAYHSQTPDIGADYLRRLASFWPAAAMLPGTAPGRRGKPPVPTSYTPQFASWLDRNAVDAASLLIVHGATTSRHLSPSSRPALAGACLSRWIRACPRAPASAAGFPRTTVEASGNP